MRHDSDHDNGRKIGYKLRGKEWVTRSPPSNSKRASSGTIGSAGSEGTSPSIGQLAVTCGWRSADQEAEIATIYVTPGGSDRSLSCPHELQPRAGR